jgi:hypothetical protein
MPGPQLNPALSFAMTGQDARGEALSRQKSSLSRH